MQQRYQMGKLKSANLCTSSISLRIQKRTNYPRNVLGVIETKAKQIGALFQVPNLTKKDNRSIAMSKDWKQYLV